MSMRMAGLLCLLACTSVSCARHVRIMTPKEYSAHFYIPPYVLRINRPTASLIYFGASHTNNPDDPQISEIEQSWAQFHPEIAFNEGGNPPTEKLRDESIKKFGEPGLVRFMAARDGVPVASIDPPREEEAVELTKKFKREKVKLFFILRQVSEYGHINHPTRSLEDQLRITFANLNAAPGLKTRPSTVSELETLYSIYFPNSGSFKNVPADWFDPTRSDTFLNQIAVQDNLYRDEYMVNLLAGEVLMGKKVFAVVGFTHVVCQESALRARLEPKGNRKHQLAPHRLTKSDGVLLRTPKQPRQ